MLDENGEMVHNIKRNGKHGENYEAVINVPTQKCAPPEAETSVKEREKKRKAVTAFTFHRPATTEMKEGDTFTHFEGFHAVWGGGGGEDANLEKKTHKVFKE